MIGPFLAYSVGVKLPPMVEHTSPPFRFFIPMSPFPFLPFLFFFFLQQHFLTMQKQHVRMSSAATTAMAMMAQDGTANTERGTAQSWRGTPCPVLDQIYLVRGARLAIRLDEN